VPGWDELPASLSPESVRVLREDLGFTGVVVSDDLGMGALATWTPFQIVDLAVAAGNDLLLFVVTAAEPAALVDHLAAMVESGEISPERIAASVARLLRMQLGLSR
jgi:beta-N-acetylhexosaminidase